MSRTARYERLPAAPRESAETDAVDENDAYRDDSSGNPNGSVSDTSSGNAAPRAYPPAGADGDAAAAHPPFTHHYAHTYPLSPQQRPGPAPLYRRLGLARPLVRCGALVVAASILVVFTLALWLPSRAPFYSSSVAYPDGLYGTNNESARPPGVFFRDETPGATAQLFWRLAQDEIAQRAQAGEVDLCGDQLGRGLVDAYVRSKVAFCGSDVVLERFPEQTHEHWAPGSDSEPDMAASAVCMPVHRDAFSKWWPFPAAPCVSRNLRPKIDAGANSGFAATCPLSADGDQLVTEMGKETFLGSQLDQLGFDLVCKERIERTVLIIHRQDQWNPFHVAEDLITTLVTLFIAAAAVPGIADERLQLVFTDDFGMDRNHYTPLYDRMGAWAPRRLTLDPWREGECLTNAIHSVGAGASLLSAMGVGKSNTCVSSITWAAAHYYRNLFGLQPRPRAQNSNVINVLYLSRAKLDAYAKGHNDWSAWRGYRHLDNDAELVARIRRGLDEMCTGGVCSFEDERDVPHTWAQLSAQSPTLRFAVIDPTVHALETQVHYAGNAQVILAQHGGALGLALFLAPGAGAVLEMQVQQVAGNWHFQHLAHQTGQRYELLKIERHVDVDAVWGVVQRHVEALRAGAGANDDHN